MTSSKLGVGWLGFYLEASGRIHFQIHLICWQNPILYDCRFEVPSSLLEQPSAILNYSDLLSFWYGSTHLSPPTVHWILLMLQMSLISSVFLSNHYSEQLICFYKLMWLDLMNLNNLSFLRTTVPYSITQSWECYIITFIGSVDLETWNLWGHF